MALPTTLAHTLTGHDGAVYAVRFNRDGSYCLSAGHDKTVRLWNPHKNLAIKVYSGHSHEVHDVDAAPDNNCLVSCGNDKTVIYWDVGTGRIIRRFRGHTSRVNAVRFNEEGSVVVSGSYDSTVQIFDCRSRSTDAMQVMKEATDSVASLHLSAHQILTGSVDGFVRNYDIRAGKLRSDNMGCSVINVRFSHDDNCILVNTLDDCVRLLDKSNGELLAEYKGHTNRSYKIGAELLCSDGHVVGGSENGAVLIWELVEAQVAAKIAAHKNVVTCLSTHPTETNCFLSGSVDGSIRLWNSGYT